MHPECQAPGASVSFLDALFTATSATCVTGLIVVDTATVYSRTGHVVIMALFQLGGLGIMTYSSLIFYLWRRRVSLVDKIAVGQSLLHDPSFDLGRFLLIMLGFTLVIELGGAALLHLFSPQQFDLFTALFHSISAFCNAGFSTFSDNLVQFQANLGVNVVIMSLIVLGGLGFSVIMEVIRTARRSTLRQLVRAFHGMTGHSRVVIRVSFWLIVVGAALLFLGESSLHAEAPGPERNNLLTALFQSISCRTAGFNTVDIAGMTDVSLLFMICLMFIGGSPGSTAGGIKTTTFRVLLAYSVAKFKGREQAVIGRFAVDTESLNKALTLLLFAFAIVGGATLALCYTEMAGQPHSSVHGLFLDILFEVVSAFGTVGLSAGLTSHLTTVGKSVVILLMFIGRLGPILFLSVMQHIQEKPHYSWPEESMLIG